jgi:hypothetical protein
MNFLIFLFATNPSRSDLSRGIGRLQLVRGSEDTNAHGKKGHEERPLYLHRPRN